MAVSTEEDLRQRAEQLLQALLEPALQVAYRQLGDWEAARDVVQDVVIKILERPKPFVTARNPRAWLIRLVLNRCTDWHRWWRRLRQWQQRIRPEPMGESGKNDWFQDALNRLSRKQRMILILIYQENYSVQDVSDMLNLSPDTVRVHLMRARQKIRQFLENEKGVTQ